MYRSENKNHRNKYKYNAREKYIKKNEETYIIAIITCLRSFSTFLMLAIDCAQNIRANHELSLY